MEMEQFVNNFAVTRAQSHLCAVYKTVQFTMYLWTGRGLASRYGKN